MAQLFARARQRAPSDAELEGAGPQPCPRRGALSRRPCARPGPGRSGHPAPGRAETGIRHRKRRSASSQVTQELQAYLDSHRELFAVEPTIQFPPHLSRPEAARDDTRGRRGTNARGAEQPGKQPRCGRPWRSHHAAARVRQRFDERTSKTVSATSLQRHLPGIAPGPWSGPVEFRLRDTSRAGQPAHRAARSGAGGSARGREAGVAARAPCRGVREIVPRSAAALHGDHRTVAAREPAIPVRSGRHEHVPSALGIIGLNRHPPSDRNPAARDSANLD